MANSLTLSMSVGPYERRNTTRNSPFGLFRSDHPHLPIINDGSSSKSLHGAPRSMIEAAEIPAAPVNGPVLTVLLPALYIPLGGVPCSPPFQRSGRVFLFLPHSRRRHHIGPYHLYSGKRLQSSKRLYLCANTGWSTRTSWGSEAGTLHKLGGRPPLRSHRPYYFVNPGEEAPKKLRGPFVRVSPFASNSAT